MARNQNTRRASPAPKPEVIADLPENTGQDNIPAATLDIPEPAKVNNLFALTDRKLSEKAQRKLTLLQTVGQSLAHAAELMAEAGTGTKEADAIADNSAMALYEGRISDVITADDVSNLLGDKFGFKPLTSGPKQGQPGKTPAGLGEVIRKRIVRAVSAVEYVTNGDGGRFFVGIPNSDNNEPNEEVANIVQRLDNKAKAIALRVQIERALASDDPEIVATAAAMTDEALALEASSLTLWGAYDQLGKLKSALSAAPVALAFNPDKIAEIVEALSKDGAAAKVRATMPDGPLWVAYSQLYEMLNVIGEMPEADSEGE